MTRTRWMAAALMACLATTALAAESGRVTLNFDGDWRFFKGEPPAAPSTQPTHGNYAAIDPTSAAYSDKEWRSVTLPHDWSIEGPFDEKAATQAAGAYLPSGVGWYRKTFMLPAEAKGKRVFIEFDGVMSNSDVWINKGHLGQRPNGYVPLRYDLTNYLSADGPNVLAVRTDTTRQPASRWYSGAGIYRHVRLVVQNAVHLEAGFTVVGTRMMGDGAEVMVKSRIINDGDQPAGVDMRWAIAEHATGPTTAIGESMIDGSGKSVGATQIVGRGFIDVEKRITIPQAKRWSIESPSLYDVTMSVTRDGKTLDQEVLPFGVRTAEFKADSGFWLNDKNIKLKGVCLHHDAGALGAAVPAAVWEYRLRELKKYGVNAIRVAHAPMAPEFYDLCDKLGLLVMDELFDVWTVGKEPADYHLFFADWWRRDMEAVIKAHRHHPSIVIWSLGNEIWDILPQNPDPALDQFTGPKRPIDVAKALFVPMRDLAHELDPARPVTLAVMRPNVNDTYHNGFADLMDVVGQNYRDAELAAAHQQKPERKILSTESYKSREAWLALRDNPALAGQFLWAGVDYLGEAGMWPNVVSPSGLLDRTGFPRGDAFERAAWWCEQPVVHVVRMEEMATRPGRKPVMMGVADWSPKNRETHAETVSVYSNAGEVELLLNEQSLGVKARDPGDKARQWSVPFAPGTLRAVARNGGKEVARDELRTAGKAVKLVLAADRTTVRHEWEDVVYVRAVVTDEAGTRVPTATDRVSFAIDGPGAIVAVDNGALDDHEPFQASQRRAYQGSCVAIMRATGDAGAVRLRATAQGLSSAEITLQAGPASPITP